MLENFCANVLKRPYFCILKFEFILQLWALNVKLGAR